jgi:hypothetical protein
MRKTLILRLAPLAFGLLALSGCKVDRSLVDLVKHHPDEFPEGYVAIAPPSQASALGLRPGPVPGDTRKGRKAVVSTARCFLVTLLDPQPGLKKFDVHYRLGKDLEIELDAIAVSAGVELDAVRAVNLGLADLRIEEARLIPNPDGCDVEDQESFEVFTQQIVAGTVELDFGTEVELSPGVEVPIAAADMSVGAAGSWRGSTNTSMSGKDIVIAAKPERWTVRVSRVSHMLGPTPRAGDYEVRDTSAWVSVISFDANGPALKLQVNSSLNQNAESLPEGWGKLGESFVLTLSEPQRNFLLAPGNCAIAVRWSHQQSTEDPDVYVAELHIESLIARSPKAKADN